MFLVGSSEEIMGGGGGGGVVVCGKVMRFLNGASQIPPVPRPPS